MTRSKHYETPFLSCEGLLLLLNCRRVGSILDTCLVVGVLTYDICRIASRNRWWNFVTFICCDDNAITIDNVNAPITNLVQLGNIPTYLVSFNMLSVLIILRYDLLIITLKWLMAKKNKENSFIFSSLCLPTFLWVSRYSICI